MKNGIVIVGAGHGAGELCSALRQDGYDGPLTLIGDEQYLPYQRPPLSKAYLTGESSIDRLILKDRSFYDGAAITLKLGVTAIEVDRSSKHVICNDGSKTAYDQLVLATGARVRKLSCAGADLAGVHYVRNIDDSDRLLPLLKTGGNLAVIGGGYIGLEIAASAAKSGMSVVVVEQMERLLARVASPEFAGDILQMHRDKGVDVRLGTAISHFEGDGHISHLVFQDGSKIEIDGVVIGIGVLPNQELAGDAGLLTGNGIIVDEFCRTSDPDIYAIGDVASHPNTTYGRIRLESVQNAVQQAKACARNLVGQQEAYQAVPWFWSDQFDARIQLAGLLTGYDTAVRRPGSSADSGSIWLYRHGRLVAVEALSEPRSYMMGKRWLELGQTPPPDRIADSEENLKGLI